jgi:hypothetical protein
MVLAGVWWYINGDMLLRVKKSENYQKISKSFGLRSHFFKKNIQFTLIMCNLQPTSDWRKITVGPGSFSVQNPQI